jgi:hypothetical protein
LDRAVGSRCARKLTARLRFGVRGFAIRTTSAQVALRRDAARETREQPATA